MTWERVSAAVIGAAALLAALIYIGRQVGKLVTLLQFLGKMPAEIDALRRSTDANTSAIKTLTSRLDNGQIGRRRRGVT